MTKKSIPKDYHYVTQYFIFNGKKYKVYGKTLQEAIEKKLELKHRLETAEIFGSCMTVKEWTKTALATCKPNVGDDYMSQMKARINKHILSQIGTLPLKDVQPIHCQLVLNTQAGMSASHIKKIRQEMYFIFDSARKHGHIRSNPCEDVTAPKGKKGTRRAITAEERKHFLKVAGTDPRYNLFMLMLYCGLRSSEAMNIKYEDIMEINGAKIFHVKGTKTENADRMVPIPPEIQAILKPNGRGNICVNKNGRPHNKSSYRRLSDSLRRDMNISMGCNVYRNQLIPPLPLADDFVPYFFRHTYCTDLKKKKVDVRIAKTLMGHSDITITANIYDHDDTDTLMTAAELLGAKSCKENLSPNLSPSDV